MARKTRTGVLKRQREAKKAERAAHKREKREVRSTSSTEGNSVAGREELEAYGFTEPPPSDGGGR